MRKQVRVAGLLEVVEHDDGAGRQQREQLPEEPAGKHCEVTGMAAREQRQTAPLRIDHCSSLTEIVEERGGIQVTGINLIPQRGTPGPVEPARHQRCLAGPGWCADPDQASFTRPIKYVEQPGPSKHAMSARTRKFR